MVAAAVMQRLSSLRRIVGRGADVSCRAGHRQGKAFASCPSLCANPSRSMEGLGPIPQLATMVDEMQAWRRDFHMHPELAFEEVG